MELRNRMFLLRGYQPSDLVYDSSSTLIVRAVREIDQVPVILKVLNDEYPTVARLARFRREYELASDLNSDGVIRVYGLEKYQHSLALVLEDYGGVSLDRLIARPGANQPPVLNFSGSGLGDFFRLALQIVAALGHIHQQKIIHKDLNPSNILVNPTDGRVKLIDFGCSSTLIHENPAFENPRVLEGTLAYISPEQTGRMNRSLDYRTDFYSLGVTFYELLSGRLPFEAQDALELAHCHIARQPTPLHALLPTIPRAVSDLVMKLLAKEAEDRYQSTQGLWFDLANCQRQWIERGEIEPFLLGQKDDFGRFQVPQHLYGREPALQTLLAAFERVSRWDPYGQSELFLVSGAPGVGKTSLVQEIHRPITQQRGYFISGKFDQLRRDIPYAGLIQAFRQLIRQLITESEVDLAAWKTVLSQALGPNGRVLVDVIPEVEWIIGPQAEAPALGAVESQNRFRLVFQHFAQVFSRPEHPLVIFLDDLQWADPASLKLIELLSTNRATASLLIVGAYRENEVHDTHPLWLTRDEIRKAGVPVTQVSLNPLALDDVTQMIADSLRCSPAKARPLAELAQAKTGGNPFFLLEFLKALSDEQLLVFEAWKWQWDLEQIRKRALSDNVVELMSGKARSLPPATRQALACAACLGSHFDLQTLAISSCQPYHQVALDLLPAVQAGLVLPLNNTYRLALADLHDLVHDEQEPLARVEFRFVHDRVQQAVYSLIPVPERVQIHYRVGRLLLESLSPAGRDEHVFTLANHLNDSRELLQSRQERTELAGLNWKAARKAKTSIAYEAAAAYVEMGLALLDDQSWEQAYDLALGLHVEAVEVAFLSGRFTWMDSLVEEVRRRAHSLLDQVPVYEIRIQALTIQSQARQALQVAFEVLRLLGVDLPQQPTPAGVGQELARTQALLAGKAVEDLFEYPEMQAPEKLAAMRILTKIMSPSHIAMPAIFPFLVMNQVQLSIQYGNSPGACVGYCLYGWILCGVIGDIDTGYRYGQLALKLLDKLDAREVRGMVEQLVAIGIRHWKEPIRTILTCLPDAFQAALEAGDLAYAGYTAHQICIHTFYSGFDLAKVKHRLEAYNQTLEEINQQTALFWNQVYTQAVQNWVGETRDPGRLTGSVMDEQAMLEKFEPANDGSGLCSLYLNKLILNYVFGAYSAALECARLAEKNLEGVAGFMMVPIFYFYDSLAHLAAWPELPPQEQAACLARVTANQEKMNLWAHHAPQNYANKYQLVEAERLRVTGYSWEASEAYDRAIDLAGENELVHEQALANELAARFYLAQGRHRPAALYLGEAHYAYTRWGAAAKAAQLQEQYLEVLRNGPANQAQPWAAERQEGGTNSISGPAQLLDLASVIKASQALSGEIVLSQLAIRLITVLAENAGAQRGFLILDEAGELVVEAEVDLEQSLQGVLLSVTLADAGHLLPLRVVHYVVRSHEAVVLDAASSAAAFSEDPYILQRQPKSVLCLPILSRGQLMGVLYLENNLVSHGFPLERVELLSILSAQAAISLENARLYARLEALVMERTKELADTYASLKKSEARFSTFMDYLPAAVFIKDSASKTLYVNKYFEQVMGKGWLGNTLSDRYDPEAVREMLADDQRALKDGIHETEETLQDADGVERIFQTTKFAIQQENALPLLGGFALDITQRKRMENELKRLASNDGLTGCYNRRRFFELAEMAFKRAVRFQHSLALIILDIDHFKQINDTFGHLVGDQVLIELVQLFKAGLRQVDEVGRYGGEEFVILAPETGQVAAVQMAERLRRGVEALKVETEYGAVSVTISLGVSSLETLNVSEPSLEMLIKRADDALMAAKALGRNRVCE